MVVVGIAIVAEAGKYLVGRRGGDGPLPGLAEFPGGKAHPGESPADAAVRECLEETGLQVTVSELLWCGVHDYPHGQLELSFFLCRVTSAGSAPADAGSAPAEPFRWLSFAELARESFPEANRPVLEQLQQRAGRL